MRVNTRNEGMRRKVDEVRNVQKVSGRKDRWRVPFIRLMFLCTFFTLPHVSAPPSEDVTHTETKARKKSKDGGASASKYSKLAPQSVSFLSNNPLWVDLLSQPVYPYAQHFKVRAMTLHCVKCMLAVAMCGIYLWRHIMREWDTGYTFVCSHLPTPEASSLLTSPMCNQEIGRSFVIAEEMWFPGHGRRQDIRRYRLA